MAASRDAAPRGRRPVRQATLLALALLALQASWVLTVPPFRGIDEFDHAYRAAAVAHGQLVPSSRPVGGEELTVGDRRGAVGVVELVDAPERWHGEHPRGLQREQGEGQ